MTRLEILDIGEVVQRSGLPPSTLRYYEERGLIQSVGRKGLRRLYDVAVLQTLTLIALGRKAGFSLSEIADMFSADGEPRIDRAQLLRKADALDKTIKQLVAMRDGLRHTAECPAPTHMECPSFQRLLKAVANRSAKRNASVATKA